MSQKQITFEEVARAEARASDLYTALQDAIKMLRTTKHNDTERYNRIADIYKAYQGTLDSSSKCLTEPLIEIARKAYEVVQADHACILGRVGSEQRWDMCMAELKSALDMIKFNV